MELLVVLEIIWPDDKRTEITVDIQWLEGIIFTLKALERTGKIKAFTISG